MIDSMSHDKVPILSFSPPVHFLAIRNYCCMDLLYVVFLRFLALVRRALAYIAAFRFLIIASRSARAALILAFIPPHTSVLSEKHVHPCITKRQTKIISLDRTTYTLVNGKSMPFLRTRQQGSINTHFEYF